MKTRTRRSRLTDAGAHALRNISGGRPGDHGLFGMSAHGGFTQTMWALRQHGWLDRQDAITDAGREALAAYDARQRR